MHASLSPRFVIKTFRVGPTYDALAPRTFPSNTILLDTWNPSFRGGTGETFDWSIAESLRPHVRRLILAGGLGPTNVSAAIRAVRPYAIDVCSGVKDQPGHKNREKFQLLLQAVRADAAVAI
jgi:phosphoribosylanthranilate isomerase